MLTVAWMAPKFPWDDIKGPSYIDFLEKNSGLLYPLIAGGAAVLILVGILAAWRGDGMSPTERLALKKEVVLELRRAGQGLSAEIIGKAVGLERFKAQKLLEEMADEGILLTYTNTQRLAVWQLKGMGQDTAGGGYH
jgi:hypothetical protein